MKLSVALSVWLLTSASSVDAFTVVLPTTTQPTTRTNYNSFLSSASTASSSENDVTTEPSKKSERLRFMKSDQFHRQGFKEVRKAVESTMQEQFQSSLVQDLRSNDFVIERDGVRVHLAKVRLFSYILNQLSNSSLSD
jgi:4-hydroxy-3-methylbut-2-en-1-yl diphosphate reductase